MYKHLTPEGKIPAGKECPFKYGCEFYNTTLCHHTGINHPHDYSCATARGFDMFAQGNRYQVGFLREEPKRNYYIIATLRLDSKIIAELSFCDMTDAQATQYIKELTTEAVICDYCQRVIGIINDTFELHHVDDLEVSVDYIKGVNP